MAGGRAPTHDALQQQAKALGDPTRLTIFRFIRSAEQPVDVAALTDHVRLNHNAVRQHLTKLVDADLVQESRARSGGRGRPHLLYELHPLAVERWLDENPYEGLSVLLAEVTRTGDDPVDVGRRAGRLRRSPNTGADAAVTDLNTMMGQLGFLPQVRRLDRGAEIVLRNCPFTSAVIRDADAVCALHRGLAEGFLLDTRMEVVELLARDPRTAQCVLRLAAAPGT